MSGLIRKTKKAFKKVDKFVRKNYKTILGAVAVYFTAGVALSYFAPTAGFAAAMPGFGAAGPLTKAASFLGFSGPANAGIDKAFPTISALGKRIGVDQVGKAGASAFVSNGTNTALIAALKSQQKLGILNLALNTASGLLSDSPDDVNRKDFERKHKSVYGVGRDGSTEFAWGKGGQNAGSTPLQTGGEGEMSQFAQTGGQQQGVGNQFLTSPFQTGQKQLDPMQMDEGQAKDQKDFLDKGYERGSYLPA